VTIFVAAPDGSSVRAVPGTSGGYGPVFAPDGRTIAFARKRERTRPRRDGPAWTYESSSVWLVGVNGGQPHRLTRWRDGLDNYPSSFSPDGSALAMTRIDKNRTEEPEAVLLSFTTHRIELIAENGSEPTYSPDGSKIALLHRYVRPLKGRVVGRFRRVEETTDLYLLNTENFARRRLTDTPSKLELSPSWDPSGERLAYTQFRGGGSEAALLGLGSAIMQINPDGTCRTKTLSAKRTAVYGPAWQPGPGREAGRIAC
jgi:Tol biopolymer transport system component